MTDMSIPTQDSSLGRTTRKVEIEDERKNNLLSIMVREPHLIRDWSDCTGLYFASVALLWSISKHCT